MLTKINCELIVGTLRGDWYKKTGVLSPPLLVISAEYAYTTT